MIFGFFTLFVALAISGIAAYYSIVGLTAIFSAAVVPIIIMGAALEVGKIVAALWLKINWRRAALTYKIYLVPAVAVLMLLTSMGIFGFLSKAHSDQSLSTSNADARIMLIDEKIKAERDAIDVARKALQQLDDQVDQIMSRSKDERGAERSAQIRRNQARERTKLLQDVEAAQKRILALNEERAPLAAEFRKIESEVGPIKYIAALIYDENPDNTILEKAVRLVIIIIVAVFDPLALVLILAAQQSIRWGREDRARRRELKAMASTTNTSMPEIVTNPAPISVTDPIEPVPPKSNDATPVDHFDISKHTYLKKPWIWAPSGKPIVAEKNQEPSIDIEPPAPEKLDEVELPTIPKTSSMETMELKRGHHAVPKEAAERPNLKKQNTASGVLADNDTTNDQQIKAHFGITFPVNPEKGELFLRVDYYPGRLFKYNGSKWIEVDKNLTDSYVYNEDYIKYLVEEIDRGNVEPDDLTPAERSQIQEYLKK